MDVCIAGWHVQASGDLGMRLHEAVVELLALPGTDTVTLIGTDCPWLRPRHFREAWQAVQSVDVVYGPAADGGFYLQTVKRAQESLFEKIPWSTAQTLKACLAAAETTGLKNAQLEVMEDVDTLAEWERWLASR
jgi:hypothetical protein